MKLISMVDFIESMQKEVCPRSVELENELKIKQWWKIVKYKDFLKKQLTLGMFVPCNEKGNPIKIPFKCYSYSEGDKKQCEGFKVGDCSCDEYEKAKERILFKGFDIDDRMIPNNPNDFHLLQKNSHLTVSVRKGKTVEAIIRQAQEIELTTTALKEIGA